MNKLKELRSLRGITLRDLAEKVNINYVTLSRYENGVQQIIDENLVTLCKFFDVSSDYLLGLSDVKKPDLGQMLKTDDFQFALYDKTKDLSDRQKQDILNIIDALKKGNI